MRTSVAAGICALALSAGHPARALTLEEALARAAAGRFEVASARHELDAGEGRVIQAAVRPGLEVDLETRNALEESSAGVSIPQERGGKREARVAAARADLELLRARAEVRRLEVGHEVRRAYAAALAAEESLRLAEEARALAGSFAETAAVKVRAGAASPIEETRAAVRLHGAAADVERARREVALARAELALAVGDPEVRGEALEGRLSEDTALPAPGASAPDSPDAALLERELLLRRSLLAGERAGAVPDLTWRAAANHSRLDDEAWVTVGLSIPLPVRGWNRGAIAAAAADVARAELEADAGKRRRSAALARAQARLEASAREAAVLRDEVLADAGAAFATVQEGYRLGKFPYLDVLDASQVLLDARRQYAAALAALAEARIDADRLLGATGLSTTVTSSR